MKVIPDAQLKMPMQALILGSYHIRLDDLFSDNGKGIISNYIDSDKPLSSFLKKNTRNGYTV